ncbi:MAG: type II-A CRISPR-associated protein Csn2 [Clostridia bacterium]|nr:type II-A CRISPR-associated protein Csn2 [Clostridia bacterium]
MKFAHPEISGVFEINKPYVNTLVIENQQLFSELLCDIYMGTRGLDSKSVLSVHDTPVPIEKYAEMISSFVDLNINRKPLLNKIIARMEQISVDAEHYLRTASLLAELESVVEEWAFDIPCDIIASKVHVSAILKAIGIELRDHYNGSSVLGEKLLDYMELVREFDQDKLFILVGLRSYIDDTTTAQFLQTALLHEYRILLIDSREHLRLPMEKRLTVDVDLCEF